MEYHVTWEADLAQILLQHTSTHRTSFIKTEYKIQLYTWTDRKLPVFVGLPLHQSWIDEIKIAVKYRVPLAHSTSPLYRYCLNG